MHAQQTTLIVAIGVLWMVVLFGLIAWIVRRSIGGLAQIAFMVKDPDLWADQISKLGG